MYTYNKRCCACSFSLSRYFSISLFFYSSISLYISLPLSVSLVLSLSEWSDALTVTLST